jgi:hypothetical protein
MPEYVTLPEHLIDPARQTCIDLSSIFWQIVSEADIPFTINTRPVNKTKLADMSGESDRGDIAAFCSFSADTTGIWHDLSIGSALISLKLFQHNAYVPNSIRALADQSSWSGVVNVHCPSVNDFDFSLRSARDRGRRDTSVFEIFTDENGGQLNIAQYGEMTPDDLLSLAAVNNVQGLCSAIENIISDKQPSITQQFARYKVEIAPTPVADRPPRTFSAEMSSELLSWANTDTIRQTRNQLELWVAGLLNFCARWQAIDEGRPSISFAYDDLMPQSYSATHEQHELADSYIRTVSRIGRMILKHAQRAASRSMNT